MSITFSSALCHCLWIYLAINLAERRFPSAHPYLSCPGTFPSYFRQLKTVWVGNSMTIAFPGPALLFLFPNDTKFDVPVTEGTPQKGSSEQKLLPKHKPRLIR